jgi:uncharacterized membrane protein YtjA (UPF0391 family)
MFRFICQVLFFTACFLLLMFLVGALMPILTHPIATLLFIAVFVLFAVRLVKASQR